MGLRTCYAEEPGIAQDVQTKRLPDQHKEREAYVRGSFDVANNPIDKKIQKTIEQEQTQERHRPQQVENRPPEQVFEKSTGEKTSKGCVHTGT